jgi:peptide/nickel transport system permease protein
LWGHIPSKASTQRTGTARVPHRQALHAAAQNTGPVIAGSSPTGREPALDVGPPARSFDLDVWRRFSRAPGALAGAAVITAIVLLAVFAPLVAPHDPLAQNVALGARPPGPDHPFGTDKLGRDLFARVLYGARISIRIGITTILGPSIVNVMIAVGIVSVPVYARLARSSVLAVKETEYVDAARALGAGTPAILRRHILPNIRAPLLVQATLGIATAELEAAGLSYLGLGARPPAPEWGAMLN